MKNVIILSGFSCVLVCAATLACVPRSQPTVTAPAGTTADQKSGKKTAADSDADSDVPVDTTMTPVDTTVPAVPVVPEGVTLPTETTVQQRYPNWVDPSQSQLDAPSNAKIYNYTNDGITSVNGQPLPQVVPPGKVALVPKRASDIDQNSGRYRVTVTTDTGKSGTGNFDAESVNQANWRASVTDNGLGLSIQENAGGGGGGGGGGNNGGAGNDLENFN